MSDSNIIKFPFEIKDVEPETNAELLKYFKGEHTGFVQVGPENYLYPHKYKTEAESYYNFEARPSDIWVATFPRSGTTLTQELVWLIANNLDFNAAKSQRLTERFPFFEIVYVARNPKDVAISYYHLNRLFRSQGYIGDFERYWEYFERGLNAGMPYFSHINEALSNRHHSNVLFLNYENILKDLRGAIYKIANFLNCKLNDEGIEKLIKHLNIENFRMNPSINMREMWDIGILNEGESNFVRLGGDKSGAQSEFSANPQLLARANDWIKKNQINVLQGPEEC